MSRAEPVPGWPARLAYALTGERLDAGAGDGAGVDPVAALHVLLDRTGWDGHRVRDHARRCRAADQPWPHPLPPGWLARDEHARHQALLQQLVTELVPGRRGGSGTGGSGTAGRGDLSPRDRALLADRPPHW